jgi:hypothetical protein
MWKKIKKLLSFITVTKEIKDLYIDSNKVWWKKFKMIKWKHEIYMNLKNNLLKCSFHPNNSTYSMSSLSK